VPPEAIKLFVDRTGVSKADNNIDLSVLEDCVRESLDPVVPRAMAVLEPLRVVLTDWSDGEVDMLSAPKHPKLPELGQRDIPFSGKFLIDRDDFSEDPPPKYQRLVPGGEVRLRYGFVIKCEEVIKDGEGNVVELRCTHEPGTRQGGKTSDGRKVKGIIHWVDEERSARSRIMLYDRLFLDPNPGSSHADGDFLRDVNPDSLKVLTECAIETYASKEAPGTRFQFERVGYFCIDQESSAEQLQLNRIVTLRDTWASKA